MTGPGIFSYSTTPASNVNANTGINWDEGMPPASVNNSARQNMTDLRNAFNDLVWFRYGKGDLDYSPVYVSGTSYKIAGIDVTAKYEVGRRTKAVGSGTGTIYGTITATAFSTDTTVTVVWDSGSLSNETLVVYLSQIPVTGTPVGVNTIRKPAFLAHLASTVNNATGNANLASVTFDTEIFDTGANFASSTFTAPVTGKYRFSLSVVLTALDAVMTTQQVQLVIAGTSAKTYAKQLNSAPIAGGSISLDLSVIVPMTATDTAVVKISASGGAGNTAGILGGAAPVYTWFSGELVTA